MVEAYNDAVGVLHSLRWEPPTTFSDHGRVVRQAAQVVCFHLPKREASTSMAVVFIYALHQRELQQYLSLQRCGSICETVRVAEEYCQLRPDVRQGEVTRKRIDRPRKTSGGVGEVLDKLIVYLSKLEPSHVPTTRGGEEEGAGSRPSEHYRRLSAVSPATRFRPVGNGGRL